MHLCSCSYVDLAFGDCFPPLTTPDSEAPASPARPQPPHPQVGKVVAALRPPPQPLAEGRSSQSELPRMSLSRVALKIRL
ncbi:hypothetical protein PVL29_004527 [Vitis rotundifolia]|uniref:Uncharacterized protein n=1 Tax=Vitis rotundifolia TaxID=103349 RepID=A0AA39A897_VITRO|nr:hypothetical protein PVL29_004527 [Vitis rotundifolia]